MNNSLVNILTTHLTAADNHIVKITNNQGVKLVKPSLAKKYAFSYADILQKYDAIEHFLQVLPSKGFDENVVFTLQKTYTKNSKTTYHTIQKITQDITDTMKANPTNTNNPLPVANQSFLAAPEFMAKMVQAERAEDYKEQVAELKETLKDLRSRNRVLEEKNSSLTIKLETAKEREELRVDRELLNKKSFLETPAFEKTMETLGGLLPKILEATTTGTNGAVTNQLGNPNLSPVKKAFTAKLPTATDEQILFFNYLLDNWKEDLIKQIAQIIEEKEL